jgi:hypothetical protein
MSQEKPEECERVMGEEKTTDSERITDCDLCGQEGDVVVLHGKCHFLAPLKAELDTKTNVLTLRCYVPECAKIVAQFEVKEIRRRGKRSIRRRDPESDAVQFEVKKRK